MHHGRHLRRRPRRRRSLTERALVSVAAVAAAMVALSVWAASTEASVSTPPSTLSVSPAVTTVASPLRVASVPEKTEPAVITETTAPIPKPPIRDLGTLAPRADTVASYRHRIDEAIADMAAAIAAFEAPAIPEITADMTVAELWESTDQVAAATDERIEAIAETVREVDRRIKASRYMGVPVRDALDIHHKAVAWLQAQRAANRSDLCRDVLPAESESWSVARLGDYRPYAECVTAETNKVVERLNSTAADLTVAFEQLAGH